MRKWLNETVRTLSVSTYHPLGWSLDWGLSQFAKIALRRKNAVRFVARAPEGERDFPILLVHGIFHNASAFYRLERRLRKRNFTNLALPSLWTSLRTLEDMAEQLKSEVRVALTKSEQKDRAKASLVAHSLGGIVTRVALLDPNFAKQIDTVIFLGTPHQGRGLYQFRFPRALSALSPKSALLKRLREEPLPGGIAYWNLRGNLDVVTPRASTFLPHVPNLNFEGVGHAGLLTSRQVMQSVLEILEAPHYDRRSHGAASSGSATLHHR